MTDTTVSPATGLPRGVHGPARADRQVILLTLLVIPVSYSGLDYGGFAVSGWMWVTVLVLGAMTLLSGPIDPTSLRYAAPFLIYLTLMVASIAWTPDIGKGVQTLAQWATPLVVYLVAWRAFKDGFQLTSLRNLSLYVMAPVILLIFVRGLSSSSASLGWLSGQGARPFAMTMVCLFVMASLGRSRLFTVSVGLASLGLVVLSGGRMGTLAMSLAVLAAPSLRIRWRTRTIAGVIALVLVGLLIVPTQAFQDRWFFEKGGTATDIFGGDFNTAGRDQNWPVILAACDENPLFGHGSGASTTITREATNGKTNHPHNEFIRTYCDAGMAGAVSFWVFFALILFRALLALSTGLDKDVAISAIILVGALLLFSATDNVTIYTPIFMAPAAIVLAASDTQFAKSRRRHSAAEATHT